MSRIFVLILFLVASLAQAEEVIRSYKLSTHSTNLDQIANEFEIVGKDDKEFEVYVPWEKEKRFLSLSPDAVLFQKDINSYLKSLKEMKSSILDSYRKFPQIEVVLQNWVAKYPSLVSLEVYGKTTEGRNLYALRLGTQSAKLKPELMISAATHGDELITVEVLLLLVQELLEGYGVNQRLSKMLDEHFIYILPVASPDGFANQTRYVAGKDPNRVFPWPENTTNSPLDCIDSWMKFAGKHSFVGSIDLHAYGQMVMFPWGYTKSSPAPADEKEMQELVDKMSQQNGYKAGQISKTIYVAKGNSADYFYWKHKTKAIAVEFTDQKIPNPARIPGIVSEAREMIWQFVEHF